MAKEIASLEAEIEQTRARLAATIDQLAYRASPKTIVTREVSAVKGFFVDPASGSPRTGNIIKLVGGIAGTVAVFALVRVVTR